MNGVDRIGKGVKLVRGGNEQDGVSWEWWRRRRRYD